MNKSLTIGIIAVVAGAINIVLGVISPLSVLIEGILGVLLICSGLLLIHEKAESKKKIYVSCVIVFAIMTILYFVIHIAGH